MLVFGVCLEYYCAVFLSSICLSTCIQLYVGITDLQSVPKVYIH